MSKYIFVDFVPGGALVKNKKTGDTLGHLKLYPKWRRVVFVPDEGTVWSSDCLEAIVEALKRFDQHQHDIRNYEKEIRRRKI